MTLYVETFSLPKESFAGSKGAPGHTAGKHKQTWLGIVCCSQSCCCKSAYALPAVRDLPESTGKPASGPAGYDQGLKTRYTADKLYLQTSNLRCLSIRAAAAAAAGHSGAQLAVLGGSACGAKVKLYWPLDQKWYTGTVTGYDAVRVEHIVSYEDGVSF